MKALHFIGDFWYVPLIVVGAVLGMFFRYKSRGPVVDPIQKITNELKAIAAKRETREIQLKFGMKQAKKHVQNKYADKRKVLDAKAEAKAVELENDPVALAKYLEYITRGSG